MSRPYKTKDGRQRVDVELPRKADGSRNRQPIYGDSKQECIKNEFEFKKEFRRTEYIIK